MEGSERKKPIILVSFIVSTRGLEAMVQKKYIILFIKSWKNM